MVRLRGVELEDWETLYNWSLDMELGQMSDSYIFPPSKKYYRKWTAELAAKDPTDMTIREQITADLKVAMKAKQLETVSTLRTILGEIANAEAVETDTDFVPMIGRTNDVPRRVLTDDDIRAILTAEADNHRAAIAEFQTVGRQDAVERLQAGLDLILGYLDW